MMPRVGFTWAPFGTGTTTLRASWGIFYDWLPTSTYEQTLRVDGFRQQELELRQPVVSAIPPVVGPASRAGQPLRARRRLELPRIDARQCRRRSALRRPNFR